MEETFKNIRGFEGYMISNQGTVKSFRRSPSGLIIKPYKKGNGMYVQLFKDSKKRAYSLPILVLVTFKPDEERGTRVKYLDDNIENNRIDNLEWSRGKPNTWFQRNKHKLK